MPFTFAHPSILIPFKYLPSRWYSTTGLIIGAIVPDFEYFFRMKVVSTCSHSLTGLFIFNLPTALVLSFVFHLLVKKPLFNNSPLFIQKKLNTFSQLDWTTHFKSHYLIIILSVLIGSISHVAWDSFTHEHGFMVEQLSVLKDELIVGSHPFPFYKIMQHLSTMLGTIAIGIQFYKLPNSSITTKNTHKQFWPTALATTLAIVSIRFYFGLTLNQVGTVIVTIISASMIGVLLGALRIHVWKYYRNNYLSLSI